MRRTMRSTWLDWQDRDRELEEHVEALAAFRKRWRARLGADARFLDGKLSAGRPEGRRMAVRERRSRSTRQRMGTSPTGIG